MKMASILAFPVQFRNGAFVVHTDDTDPFYTQLLSMALMIQPDELPLNPNFGTSDPTFTNISRATIIEKASKYVPEILITGISDFVADSGEELVQINFTR